MSITAKGQPNGLSTLDSDGRVPVAQVAQGAAVADVAALTSAAASGGESPTEVEYNALHADVVALRATVNGLLASLRTAGLLGI